MIPTDYELPTREELAQEEEQPQPEPDQEDELPQQQLHG
jgi:hypothetical protein